MAAATKAAVRGPRIATLYGPVWGRATHSARCEESRSVGVLGIQNSLAGSARAPRFPAVEILAPASPEPPLANCARPLHELRIESPAIGDRVGPCRADLARVRRLDSGPGMANAHAGQADLKPMRSCPAWRHSHQECESCIAAVRGSCRAR